MALVFWAEMDAATDTTMAAAVDLPGGRTRGSVIALVQPVVDAAIADNPTVINAAVTAVNDAIAGLTVVSATNATVATSGSWTENSVDYFPSVFPSTFAGGTPVPVAQSAQWPRLNGGRVDESVIPTTVARVSDVQTAVDEALAAGGGGGVAAGLGVGGGFAVPAWGQSPVSHSTGSAFMLTGHVEAGAGSFEPGATVVTGSGWAAGRKVAVHSPDGLVLLVTTATGINVDTVLSGGAVPWVSLDGAVVARAG